MEKDTSGELVDSAYCLMSCLTSLLHLGMIEMRKDDGRMMGMILLLEIFFRSCCDSEVFDLMMMMMDGLILFFSTLYILQRCCP